MDQSQKPTPAAYLGKVTPEERQIAVYAVVSMYRDGYTQREILDALESENISPLEFLQSIRALQRAGELDHLFTLVWSRHFERKS